MWHATRAYSAFNAAFGRRFRPRRMLAFCDALRVTTRTRVLDVGGSYYNWSLLPEDRRPRVTLVNVELDSLADRPADVAAVRASALDLPFVAGDFDVIFSNSVIEHVGGLAEQQRFAAEIRRLGVPYWIQTPNYHFPVEPHFLGIGIQFLPPRLAVPYARWASAWGWSHGWNARETRQALASIRLLDARALASLFPDAAIERERVLGLTKSLMAVRRSVTSG